MKQMREEDCNRRLSRWEEQLPSPEELTPLSQTLITPDLAVALGIQRSSPAAATLPDSSSEMQQPGGSGDFDSSGRGLKRPRLVWTPQLHKRFVDAVAHLGIKNAVPKTIMQLMSVDGLTRENVASHLQKYRLYLKRMQGLNCGGGAGDPATDRLFASSHFLHPQMAMQYHHYRQMGTFTSGSFEHPLLAMRTQMGVRLGSSVCGFHVEDAVDSGTASASASHGRSRVLTLFPTGNND